MQQGVAPDRLPLSARSLRVLAAAGELVVVLLARSASGADTFSIQVFYVENHARFAKLTIAQFLASHEVTVVPSVATARQALAQSTFDIVLVDYDCFVLCRCPTIRK